MFACAAAGSPVIAGGESGASLERSESGLVGFDTSDAPLTLPAAVDEAFTLAHISSPELTLPTDYEIPDPWRLALVDRALEEPLSVGMVCHMLAGGVARDSLAHALAAVNAGLRGAEAGGPLSPLAPRRARSALGEARESAPPPGALLGVRPAPGTMLARLEEEMRFLASSLAQARALVSSAFSELSNEEKERLRQEGPRLIEEDPLDTEKTIFELETEKWEEVALADTLFAITRRIDVSPLAEAALLLGLTTDELLLRLLNEEPFDATELARELSTLPPALRIDGHFYALPTGEVALADGRARGDIILYREWEGMRIILGGPGTTEYGAPFDLIVDLGGDDRYLAGAGGTHAGEIPAAFSFDLAGDDLYIAGSPLPGSPAAVAAGYLGVGVLVDVAGDDRYRAGNFGLGCGWYGWGVLLDLAGDDEYRGDTAVEGAGSVGAGLLSDRGGSDLYQAAFASQGFGFVGGLGAIDDREGHDSYLVRARYTDILRYEDHFLSLSQGFGFGYRPEVSGGIGLIVEGEGNDLYLSDIFGQGASYWYALGCLVDRAGNDSYVSYQYAQGSGVHLAAAALLDEKGGDRYASRGVSQGCGHDLAVGLLWDREGDDSYMAYDLSQGAGSANGLGFLVDERGEDGYWVKRADNTHGYGNPRRHYGSVGLLADLAGRDHYGGSGRDSIAWRGSWFGVGFDRADVSDEMETGEGGAAAEPAFTPAREYTVEELFTMASSGELRFAPERDWARERLLELGSEAVPALIERLGTTDARDRHTVRELLVKIGEPALEPLIEALGSEAWRTTLLAARTLGELGDARAEEALTEACGHDRWVVRESAATALGELGLAGSVPDLADILADDESAYVRKSAAFALGGTGVPEAVDPLINALDDSHAIVRETARRSLVALDSLSAPALSSLLTEALASPADFSPREVALAVEALTETSPAEVAGLLLGLTSSPLFSDPELRASFVTAAAALPAREKRELLRKLEGDPHWLVRSLLRGVAEEGAPEGAPQSAGP